ncbi:Signal transduction histidine kinase, phosphotransfer (Hpt) region domain protein [Candidatus Magnetomorum sp. HK-1]|nr:Signal transduction histidine kinase, phosphotransfer (Hpt) region domain protein [Candidatus Magnetomorum sp. HK-1]
MSKPINQNILFDILSKMILPKNKDINENSLDTAISYNENSNIKSSFDVNYGVEKLGLEREIFNGILIRFKAKHLDIINKIKDAYFIKDWDELTKISHSLKGAFSNIGANLASSYGSSLEMLCKEKNMESSRNIESAYEIIEKLEIEIKKVFDSIDQIKT